MTGRSVVLCPLHTERTPSFWIRWASRTWCCYGCGESGSLDSPLTPDVVRDLARRLRPRTPDDRQLLLPLRG